MNELEPGKGCSALGPVLFLIALCGACVVPGNDAIAQESPLSQLPEPDWVAPALFTWIQAVRELPTGLLVSDGIEGLFFIGWDSAEPRPVGRRGQGPGEFLSSGPLFALAADSTLLLDRHTGRWLLLRDTVIVETVGEGSPLIQAFRTSLVGTDTLGHVLGERSLWIRRPGRALSAPDSVFLVRGNRSTLALDTLARIRGEAQDGATVVAIDGSDPWLVTHNPLAPRDLGALFPDGWIALLRYEPYRVDWRKPDGEWIFGVPIPYERVPVHRAHQCHAMENLFGDRLACRPDQLPAWPDQLPPFVRIPRSPLPALFPGPDGRLIVHRTPSPGYSGSRYDVIDRFGRRTASLLLDPDERIVHITSNAVYTLVSDHLDLQELRRRPWKEPPP